MQHSSFSRCDVHCLVKYSVGIKNSKYKCMNTLPLQRGNNMTVFLLTADPITAPNPVYDLMVKCSNDPITADNPVYGVRIGVIA